MRKWSLHIRRGSSMYFNLPCGLDPELVFSFLFPAPNCFGVVVVVVVVVVVAYILSCMLHVTRGVLYYSATACIVVMFSV